MLFVEFDLINGHGYPLPWIGGRGRWLANNVSVTEHVGSNMLSVVDNRSPKMVQSARRREYRPSFQSPM